MTSKVLPHDPYMDAIDQALTTAGLGGSDGWTSVGDEYDDHGGLLPSAVFLWSRNEPAVNTDELPDGLVLHWTSEAGWEYAPLLPDGSNEAPLRHTFLDVWAAPDLAVATVRELLAGDKPTRRDGEWEHAETAKAAVEAWRADAGVGVGGQPDKDT